MSYSANETSFFFFLESQNAESINPGYVLPFFVNKNKNVLLNNNFFIYIYIYIYI